jgi:ABC-type bacteriocin/lantibiotic exporter with double-glycine peptidase domain
MINVILILLIVITLPLWLILLAMVSPMLIPIAFFGIVWIISRKVKELGESMTKYEKMAVEAREKITNGLEIKTEPRPKSTADKILQRNGYTIEFYLREKPPVYRILDQQMNDLGINYTTLREAIHEVDSYTQIF